MESPDFSKIPYPSISKLFKKEGITSPAELQAVCYDGHRENYTEHQASFEINAPLTQVWEGYNTIHPAKCWNSSMIRFGMMYDRGRDKIHYAKDYYPGLEKGQVYLINLNIVSSVLQIAVAHEVDEIDQNDHTLKLCYLNSGKTFGSQWIQFKEQGKNKTLISHRTLYKGTSFIRDRMMYPYFHSKAMKQFHHNMEKLITFG